MSDCQADHDVGDEAASELAWLADRFVLGELAPAEEQAVADRLPHDDALAAAVARSSRLVVALRAAAVVRRSGPQRAGRFGIAMAAVAAGVALVACWPMLASRFGPLGAGGGPREVVRLWRQADDGAWIEEETSADDEAADGDTVPDWMLAAVGLDGPPLEPDVQEN